MKKTLNKALRAFSILLVCAVPVFGQEFNCQVKIEAIQIETTERRVFSEMEVEFSKFLNDRKWSEDRFENNERINCGINITLESQPSIGTFSATVQVIAARPVFNSSYESVLINFADRDFNFEYNESQPLDFNPNSFTSNITSLLAYYAYIMLGHDYDSFEKLGGQKHFEQAWSIVNNAQQSGYAGWDQFNSVRNRYWLSENMINQILQPMREGMYEYHLKGLDMMASDPDKGRENMLEGLKKIQIANRARPRSIMVISFLDSKLDEVVSVFSQGDISVRREAYNILKTLDPARTGEFKKILEN
jgi:hypothetical protein